MEIREARPADAAVLAEHNARLALETEDRAPDRAVLRRGVQRGLARPDLCRYWVADDGGTVVGQAMVTWEWSDWRDGVVWWLQSVFVVPERRGQGVFRRIYAHVEAEAKADPDVRGLRLYVERDNGVARRVYAQLGMRGTDYLVYEVDWSAAFPDARDTRKASRT